MADVSQSFKKLFRKSKKKIQINPVTSKKGSCNKSPIVDGKEGDKGKRHEENEKAEGKAFARGSTARSSYTPNAKRSSIRWPPNPFRKKKISEKCKDSNSDDDKHLNDNDGDGDEDYPQADAGCKEWESSSESPIADTEKCDDEENLKEEGIAEENAFIRGKSARFSSRRMWQWLTSSFRRNKKASTDPEGYYYDDEKEEENNADYQQASAGVAEKDSELTLADIKNDHSEKGDEKNRKPQDKGFVRGKVPRSSSHSFDSGYTSGPERKSRRWKNAAPQPLVTNDEDDDNCDEDDQDEHSITDHKQDPTKHTVQHGEGAYLPVPQTNVSLDKVIVDEQSTASYVKALVENNERRKRDHLQKQDKSSESEEASSESEEARRLLQTLSMRGPAIPHDLHSEIKMLLRAEKVKMYQLSHEPTDIHIIVLHGVKVRKIQHKLDNLLLSTPEFSEFSVTTIDIAKRNCWINMFALKPCYALSRNSSAKMATIQLVVTATDQKQQNNEVPDIYAVSIAHALMTKEQRESPSPGYDFPAVFESMARESWSMQPFLSTPNGRSIDVAERPLPVYKYLYPIGRFDEQFLVYDMAITKMNAKQFEEMLSSENCNCYEVVEPIVEIKTGSDLAQYVGKKIVCGGKAGLVQPQVVIESNGWIHGSLISFTLDDGERLEAGDCGLVVYLVDDSDETKHYAYGMLIGNLTLRPDVYLAMSISYGLKKIEEVEELKVTDIEPLQSPRRQNAEALPNNYHAFNLNVPMSISVEETIALERIQQPEEFV